MSAGELGPSWRAVPLSELYQTVDGELCGHPVPVYRDVLAVFNDDQHGLQVGETISRPAEGVEEAMRGVRRDVGRCDAQSGITPATDAPSFGDDSFTYREVSTLPDGTPLYTTLTFVRRGDLLLTVRFKSYIRYVHEWDVVNIAGAKFQKLVDRPHT
jgi:hypothetical protein